MSIATKIRLMSLIVGPLYCYFAYITLSVDSIPAFISLLAVVIGVLIFSVVFVLAGAIQAYFYSNEQN